MDDLDILMGLEPPDKPTILDLCSGTGSWSNPYKIAGYTVIEVTLPEGNTRLWPSGPSLSSRFPSEYGDVREWIGKIHGILAGPPCTYFSNAGAHIKRTDQEIQDGLAVADACIRLAFVLKPAWWVLENPVGKLVRWIGNPVYKFQPCDFGDPYTKETWLWGRFKIPEMNYVVPTEGSKMTTNIRSQANRSITPQGFANAFFQANP